MRCAPTNGAGRRGMHSDIPAEQKRCLEKLRLLVIAHDFPPVRSPQSIRAQEILSSLVSSGWEVVLVTRRGSHEIDDCWPFHIIRVSAGWFESFVDALGNRRRTAASPAAIESTTLTPAGRIVPPTLNWKGRLIQKVRCLLGQILFPDATVLWARHAQSAVVELLHGWRPDVALVMHEPPSTLCLASTLERLRIPWVADLADPVLAPYTLPWWRGRAFRLEARTLALAASVTVTNASTAMLLHERHPSISFTTAVVRQGFAMGAGMPPDPTPGPLRLLYTGRFYSFRRPEALLAAIEDVDDVILTIAGPEMPGSVLRAAARLPGRIVLAGDIPHEAAKALQEQADVLVCVANANTVQVPGKFFEYLGAARPILHLKARDRDELADVLARLNRGEAVMNEKAAVGAILRKLREAKAVAGLNTRYDLSRDAVRAYSWEASAAAMGDVLRRAASLPLPL